MFHFLSRLLLFFVRWVVPLIGLAVLVLIPYLYCQVDDVFQSKVQEEVERAFPGLTVQTGHVELVSGKGIRISNIDLKIPFHTFTDGFEDINARLGSLVLPREKSGRFYLQYDFVHIDELFLEGDTDWNKLAHGQFVPRSAVISGAEVKLYPVDQERWNFQYLKLGKTERLLPTAILKNLDCTITDYRKSDSVYHLRDVQVDMNLEKKTEVYVFGGSLTGDYARQLTFSGRFNPKDRQFQIAGAAAECEVSSRLFKNLPQEWLPRDEFSRALVQNNVKNVQALLSMDFDFRYNPCDTIPLRYSLQGSVVNGRWDYADLPTPLSKLESHFVVSNEGVYLKSFTGQYGTGRFSMTYRQQSFAKNPPLSFQARLENMELDTKIASVLPEQYRKGWESLKPHGTISASISGAHDGQSLKTSVLVDCFNAGLEYEKFPYPLSNLKGTIQWKDQRLQFQLSDSEKISLSGNLFFPPTGIEGAFSLTGKQILVDEKLSKACPEKAEQLINSFSPQGSVDIGFSMGFKGNGQKADKRLNITIIDCEGRYDKFPYPLHEVNGQIEMNNDRWTFHDFRARNNNTVMTGAGSLNLTEDEPNDFLLKLVLGGVPMDKTLFSAMPRENAELLENLGVSGAFDSNVTVRMRLGVDDKPRLELCAAPHGADAALSARSLPYRITDLSGEITFKNNRFHIENFEGKHGQSRIQSQVDGMMIPGYGWMARLTGATVDQLQVNRELLEALPESVRRLLSAINLSGPIYYRGNVNLAFQNNCPIPLNASWNGELGIQEGSLGRDFKMRGISGGLTTSGAWVNNWFYAQGELDIKSLLWDNMQFSQITGPYKMNNKSLYLGSAAFDAGKKMYPDLTDSFETLEMDGVRGAMNSLFSCDTLSELRAQLRKAEAGEKALEQGFGPNSDSEVDLNFDFLQAADVMPSNVSSGTGAKKTKSLRSLIFGGEVFADIAILFDEKPRFGAYVTAQNIRLEQCGTITQSESLRGRAQLVTRVRGYMNDINQLSGRGEFRLSEADVYELPAMVSMLKLLSIRRPDNNAFSNAEATFRLSGPHLFFERINFRGDAISLYGSGDMDFNKRVNLSFYTLMGRGEVAIPVVNELFRGVSKQLMLIRMEGPVNNLRTWREVPMVNDSLRQVEQELNSSSLQLPPPPNASGPGFRRPK